MDYFFIPPAFAAFLMYFGSGLWFLLVFVLFYVRLTPYREFDLIRAGNQTAALALSGNIIGYAIVLYTAMAHSVSGFDMLVWGVVGLAAQYLAYQLLHRLFFKDWHAQLMADNRAVGIIACALSIAVGLINAASMTY